MSKTHQVIWGILCLFALAATVVIEIGRHYPSPDSMLATDGSVRFAIFLIGAVTAALSVWLWKNRDVDTKATITSSESKQASSKTILGSILEPMVSLDDFQKSWSSARRSVSISEAILNHIRTRMNLWGNGRVVIGTAKDALLIRWLLENEYVPKGDIAKAVHERLCEIGRNVYDWHVAAPLIRYPDHSVSPEALGYALLHGAISAEEAGMIRFDHGETVDEYRKMAEGLHESVMRQLTAGNTYFSIPKVSGSDDCCCEYCL